MTMKSQRAKGWPLGHAEGLGVLALCLVLGIAPTLAEVSPAPAPESTTPSNNDPGYVLGERHGGGTGRYYFGREIAAYMSHVGAEWLERPERIAEEAPEQLHALLNIKPGMKVADAGAGTGYHSRRLARAVGPEGVVYAVDIQAEMLDQLQQRAEAEGLRNIEGVLGSATDPGLATASVDAILLVDVYHEFSHPYEMTQALVRALRPGGELILVEYQADNPNVPIHPLHAMTTAQVRLEFAIQDLTLSRVVESLPWQRVFFFKKTELP